MEGSGSGNRRGGHGLPPVAPRRNRRRMREENPNIADADAEAEAEADPNLQPQPQQVEAGAEMQPAATDDEIRSRLANRRYSEAYRNRRQNHVQELLAQQANYEAQIAHNTSRIQTEMVQRTLLQAENMLLKERHDAIASSLITREVQTEMIRAAIQAQRGMNASQDQETAAIASDPTYFHLHDTYLDLMGAALGPFYPIPPPPPPPGEDFGVLPGPFGQNPPPNPDEAGPSGGDNDPDDGSAQY